MKERILCVDDEPVVLAVLKYQLGDEFDVSVAVGGEQGLATVEGDGPFAVIVADHGMPGMDGEQFLARVREIAPHTARILLTGDTLSPSTTNAVNDGTLFRFLTKPCPIQVFRQAVRIAVEQYHSDVADRNGLERML